MGKNGSGKSTIIEALAVSLGLSAEGGTRNMAYETYNSTSVLNRYLTVIKSGLLPKWKYFLRAETFYTMAQAISHYDYDSDNVLAQSHGEAFNALFDDFSPNGRTRIRFISQKVKCDFSRKYIRFQKMVRSLL